MSSAQEPRELLVAEALMKVVTALAGLSNSERQRILTAAKEVTETYPNMRVTRRSM
jgi:2-phospho-L-lactate guanylyltransferase (CobY/MobA/RfbA family)